MQWSFPPVMESSRNCSHKFFFQWFKIQLYNLQIVPTACQRFRYLSLPQPYSFTLTIRQFPSFCTPKRDILLYALKILNEINTATRHIYVIHSVVVMLFYVWPEESERTRDTNILVPKMYWCWSSQWNAIPLLIPFLFTCVFIYTFSYIRPRALARTDRALFQIVFHF